MEDTIHPDTSVKRSKEMVRAPKKKKKSRKQRFGFQVFPICKDYSPCLVVKDVGTHADLTIGQLVTMVPSIRSELKKGLSTPKVPKVPTPLNIIATECECAPITIV
jgi:hypothetical protein